MEMTHRFDKDIALICLDRDESGAGNYQAEIQPTWSVHVGPNGGYIAAILLNAMLTHLEDPARQPRSITFHFLSPSIPGPAEVTVQTHKLGRSLATLSASLLQGGRTIAMALCTFAPAREQFSFMDFSMPDVLSPAQVPENHRMNAGMSGHVAFRDHYDQRLAIGPIPPDAGSTPEALVGGWTRFSQPRQMDSLAVVAISDSWFPSLFARSLPARVHAPSVDHSVHFFTSLPLAEMNAEDFVLVEFRTEIVQEGFLQEDGRIWSPRGHLIAQSRQLAVVLNHENQ